MNPRTSLSYVLLARTAATLLILLFVYSFVLALISRGYDLQTSLIGASIAGMVSAEITHRLLPTTASPQA